VNVKLLLDENLSAWAANVLCTEDGIDACHVRDRSKLGLKDPGVLDLAFKEDRILVTANVDDFVALARQRGLHAGMVLLEVGDLYRDEQLVVIRAAIAALQNEPDLVNRVLWIRSDRSMEFEDIPPP
jgi:predicted nuclease of predicted toxin-antitoxin system